MIVVRDGCAAGQFRVRTENVTAPGSDVERSVAIAVSDTGSGMPPEVVARAFEPFFTTKEVGKGTGLGLPQVYTFAQQSQGSVRITSEVGRGTTFTISLPRTQGAVVETPRTSHDSVKPERPLRVLVVEDNAQVAEVAVSILADRGHAVVSSASALEALHVLDSGQPFDVGRASRPASSARTPSVRARRARG